MSHKPNLYGPGSSQDGITLLGVMVAVGLLGIVGAIAAGGFGNLMAARRSAQASAAGRDAQDVIVQSIADALTNYVRGHCAVGSMATAGVNTVSIGTLATAQLTNTVALPSGVMNTAAADINRCATTAFNKSWGPPVTDPTTARYFYACYQLNTQPAAASKAKANAASFAANKGAFIELYVTLKDLRWDADTPCSAMVAGNGMGMEIFYSLHWVFNSSTGLLYKTKVGQLDVPLPAT